MSYLVLARKWRPREFSQLVGQEHVVRALTHALTTQRLHHAYLFTGTRGIGKTTISRIMAKSLNCIGEDGNGTITATPCGKCQACTSIDAGRFADYIEMDAASNRGVDEMAALLEQAVYAPVVGRFKVYMIDEVHMLTNHAFNAMLKTLEEPPAHVKFILATTDPQKIPVTVLSRCMQLNLKQMPPSLVAQHLHAILQAENVTFEQGALNLLGAAARGSMRDALSLLDQAIAYGGGQVPESAVRGMLGTVDHTILARLVQAALAGQAQQAVELVGQMAQASVSFAQALTDLAVLLSRVALAQSAPAAIEPTALDAEQVTQLAAQLSPELVQLYYTVVLRSRAELPLAPDEQTGFTMAMLRLCAFKPASVAQVGQVASSAPLLAPAPVAKAFATTVPVIEQAVKQGVARTDSHSVAPVAEPQAAKAAVVVPLVAVEPVVQTEVAQAAAKPVGNLSQDTWPSFVAQLDLKGLSGQVAKQSQLLSATAINNGMQLHLRVASKSLTEGAHVDKLIETVRAGLGAATQVKFEVGTIDGPTLHAQEQSDQAARQQAAQQAFETDPFVQDLQRLFDATLVPGSIKPV